VFISYARSDASAFAEDLLAGLEVAGFEPFLDRHDIAAGEDWEARLGALIQAADTVVFVVSPAAAQSERCAWEVARAEALSKRIIPVVAIDVPEADTPKGLSRRNYIFFGADRSFVRALAELAAALKTDIDWIREHTRLGELAARWSERNRAEALLLRGSELDAAKSLARRLASASPGADRSAPRLHRRERSRRARAIGSGEAAAGGDHASAGRAWRGADALAARRRHRGGDFGRDAARDSGGRRGAVSGE
jgi:hypothetical protein